jgi:hypothetical protein
MIQKLKYLMLSLRVKLKLDYVLSVLILILSPWFLVWFVTSIISNNSLLFITPYWNDEISYWHEILSFSTKGLNFGYYTINELTPKLLSFGTHGFGTISLYAIYAKLFGWNYNSIMIANNLFITLSFIALILITKPKKNTIYKLSLLYLTFVPAFLYCSSSMSELLNFSLLIIYFTLLYQYLTSTTPSRKILGLIVLFVITISFVRVIYIVLFLPLIFQTKSKLWINKKTLILFISWIILAFILFIINSLFTSPYPESFLSKLFAQNNVLDFIEKLLSNITINILRFFYPLRDDLIQVFQRYFIFILLIWFTLKTKTAFKNNKLSEYSYFYYLIILISALVITVSAYDIFNWRDYRVLAPFIWGIFVYITLTENTKTYKIIILSNVIGLILLGLSTKTNSFFFHESKKFTHPIENPILKTIKFTENADNKFINTLAINNYEEDVFLNTPAGIGISYTDSITDNLKSEYIYTHNLYNLKSYTLIKRNENDFLYKKKSMYN